MLLLLPSSPSSGGRHGDLVVRDRRYWSTDLWQLLFHSLINTSQPGIRPPRCSEQKSKAGPSTRRATWTVGDSRNRSVQLLRHLKRVVLAHLCGTPYRGDGGRGPGNAVADDSAVDACFDAAFVRTGDTDRYRDDWTAFGVFVQHNAG